VRSRVLQGLLGKAGEEPVLHGGGHRRPFDALYKVEVSMRRTARLRPQNRR
jgi:hypothetical protein